MSSFSLTVLVFSTKHLEDLFESIVLEIDGIAAVLFIVTVFRMPTTPP